jgi:hypothetical protein
VLLVLLLHLTLSVIYSVVTPLGEAPDEPAHISYARFIAREGHLPTTLAQRREAGYRAAWPPLYHFLVAAPLAAIGDTPPTRLKSVGDTPRRLIPTNGQTIAAFIHTADEAWPWRGLPLAWHLARFISVGLTALAVLATYALAWNMTGRRGLALAGAALHATIPQILFVGSVANDDNLLILLSSLLLLALVTFSRRPGPLAVHHTFLVGALLGLASVAKYNALPLWPLTFIWLGWLLWRDPATRRPGPILARLVALLGGLLLTGGWWFFFVWQHFNQVETQGWLRGSFAALTAGTADASLRQIGTGLSLTLPPLTSWGEWFATLFKSFWGLFGGGSTIELAGWLYWLLAALTLLALSPYFLRSPLRPSLSPHPSALILLLFLTPLLFLPLPIVRFVLSGQIVETAQGRHLFPALPAIALILVWGFSRLTPHASRFPLYALRFLLHPVSLILLTILVSLYGLARIRASYPPPIPLYTTAGALAAEHRLDASLTDEITLAGYETGPPGDGILPLTIVWQARAVPAEDYLIDVSLAGPAGEPVGGWLGHPVGGRYPTRAWDAGDILRDQIPIPVLPEPSAETSLTLRLLDSTGRLVAGPLLLPGKLPPVSGSPSPGSPGQLRADGLAAAEPFTYRSTLSFRLAEPAPPELTAPDGQTFTPISFLAGPESAIAHFIVGADWPTGNYHSLSGNEAVAIPISNRVRRFSPPPMQVPVQANFGDKITLLGYDLPHRRVSPGDSFPLTLHLRAEQTMGQNLVIFNHLLDREAVQRGGVDRVPQNYYTTLLWVPGEIVSDAYQVPVEATAPPGIYWLDVGFYPSDRPTQSLPLVVNGRPIDRTGVRLGPVKVGGSPPEVTVTAAKPDYLLNLSFGAQGQITLLGFNLTGVAGQSIDDSPRPGFKPTLTLFWQAQANPPTDYTVFVHLVAPDGHLVAQADSPPAAGAYPTSLWDPGEIIIDSHPLPDLPPGRYAIRVGLYRPETGERLPVADSPEGAVQIIEFEIGE